MLKTRIVGVNSDWAHDRIVGAMGETARQDTEEPTHFLEIVNEALKVGGKTSESYSHRVQTERVLGTNQRIAVSIEITPGRPKILKRSFT